MCPLCHSVDANVIGKWSTGQIAELYRSLKVNVVKEFGAVEEIALCECSRCGIQHFVPSISGSEAFYDALQAHDWYYLEEKPEYVFASKHVTDKSKILEVGCGVGAFHRYIGEMPYTGLDLNSKAIEQGRNKGLDLRCETVQQHSPMHQQGYDVVCGFQVLEHVVDVRDFLTACLRCLKPGGRLILSVPAAESYLAYLTCATDFPPHHLTRWPKRTYEFIAREFALKLIAFEHEALSDCHVRFVANQLVGLWWHARQLDRPVMAWLARIFAKLEVLNVLAEAEECARSILSRPFLRPPGHSMTGVFLTRDADGVFNLSELECSGRLG